MTFCCSPCANDKKELVRQLSSNHNRVAGRDAPDTDLAGYRISGRNPVIFLTYNW